MPALHRQYEVLERQLINAAHDAGCWRFRDGPAFYEAALRAATTARLTPAEVHAFGAEQANSISSRLGALLKQQGMTHGSIGERIAALSRNAAQVFPNTDEGREQIIAYGNACLAVIRARLPEVFHRLPPSDDTPRGIVRAPTPERPVSDQHLAQKRTAQSGGRYMMRGGAVETLEGGWRPERLVIVEFSEYGAGTRVVRPAEYAEALKLARAARRRRLIFVESVPREDAEHE